MRIGTRSLIYGIHAFYLHPFFVARAWWKLYGFPTSFPLWVAFFVHDFGYAGKPNMDGEEGETHPELGAAIMTRLFGEEWGNFTLCHSRHYARIKQRNFSKLCVADKLASLMYPRWLYVFLARLTGEIKEYRSGSGDRESVHWKFLNDRVKDDYEWFDAFSVHMTDWINQNKDKGDELPGIKIKSVCGD